MAEKQHLYKNPLMTTMTEPSHATPHRLRETTADVIDEDIVLSPAYNNLLADVRSLRESLRIAETELRIMVASSPKKQRPSQQQGTESHHHQ